MLLWTRYVPAAERQRRSGSTPNWRSIPSSPRWSPAAVVRTGAYRDWTVKVTVDGLTPGTVYWYRFVALDGDPLARRPHQDPAGRRRPPLRAGRVLLLEPAGRPGSTPMATPPRGPTSTCGCTSATTSTNTVTPSIREGDMGALPDASSCSSRRNEIRCTIQDYRLRLACYRADPDLQRLHQMAPMVALLGRPRIGQRLLGGRRAEPPAGRRRRLEHAPRRLDAGLSRMDAGVGRARGRPIRSARWPRSYRTESRLLGPHPAGRHRLRVPGRRSRRRARRRSATDPGKTPRRRCSARPQESLAGA